MSAQRGFIQLFIPLLIVVFILLVVNLLIIDYHLFIKDNPNSVSLTSGNIFSPKTASSSADLCGDSCKVEIAKQLIDFKKQLAVQPSTSSSRTSVKDLLTDTTTTTTISNQPKELFITIGGNGSTKSTDWTDVTGTDITFDTANYPGLKAVYFQATLQSDGPDLTAYARIYDTEKFIGVGGSDINLTGLTATFKESSVLSLPSTKVKMRIQIHSLNGNDAIIQNPRLRLTF